MPEKGPILETTPVKPRVDLKYAGFLWKSITIQSPTPQRLLTQMYVIVIMLSL